MATLEISLPGRRVVPVVVPDGPQYVPITVLECALPGCGLWFQPNQPTNIYCCDDHRVRGNNLKQKKTRRVQKKR